MERTLLAAYDTMEGADQAIFELEHYGFQSERFSIISKSQAYDSSAHSDHSDHSDTGSHAAGGAKAGAVIGGIAGLLAGIGLAPVIAGFFVGGPILSALGIAGVAGTTAAGALTGAAAGGLIGALTKAGVDQPTAESYNRIVEAGGVIVGVGLAETDSDGEVMAIMEKHGAKDITTLSPAQASTLETEEANTRTTPTESNTNPGYGTTQPAFGERIKNDEV